jgi:hypothetical protein
MKTAIVLVFIWVGFLYALFGVASTIGYLKNNSIASLGVVFNDFNDWFKKRTDIIIHLEESKIKKTAIFWSRDDVDIYTLVALGEGRILAGTNAGLFLSTDQGENWREFKDKNNYFGSGILVRKIIFDSLRNKVFLAVVHNKKSLIYESDSMLKDFRKIIDVNETVVDLALIDEYLFLGFSNGRLLKYSLNSQRVQEGTQFFSEIKGIWVFNDLKSSLLLVADKNGLWFSADNGRIFERFISLDEYRDVNVQSLAFLSKSFIPQDFFKNNSELISLLDNKLGIYLVADSGLLSLRDWSKKENWHFVSSLPFPASRVAVLQFAPNGILYLANSKKIYRSFDFGKTWEILAVDVGKRKIAQLLFFDNKIIIGTKR